jgi:hypothetical protein
MTAYNNHSRTVYVTQQASSLNRRPFVHIHCDGTSEICAYIKKASYEGIRFAVTQNELHSVIVCALCVLCDRLRLHAHAYKC